jgi:hypothetical protein
MSKRSFSLIAAFGLIASLAFATPSQAGSVTVTYYSTVVPNMTAGYAVALTLPQFNPLLGTLQSVSLSVDATTVGQVQVINTTSGALPFSNAFTSVPVTVTGPGPTVVTTTATAMVTSGTANPGLNTFPNVGGMSTAETPVTGSLIPYMGTSTFGVTLSTTAGSASSGGMGSNGQLFFGGTAKAGGTADVTYTYLAVPEPASMGLLGIGMAGFFAFRRLFNKRSADV